MSSPSRQKFVITLNKDLFDQLITQVPTYGGRSLEVTMSSLQSVQTLEQFGQPLGNITRLNLSVNMLRQIEPVFSQNWAQLRVLDLSVNHIIEMRSLGMPSLVELNLSKNQITRIQGLEGLSSLKVLNMSMNRIAKIEGLQGCKGLERLIIYGNEIMIDIFVVLQRFMTPGERSTTLHEGVLPEAMRMLSNATHKTLKSMGTGKHDPLDHQATTATYRRSRSHQLYYRDIYQDRNRAQNQLATGKSFGPNGLPQIKLIEGLDALTQLKELNISRNLIKDTLQRLAAIQNLPNTLETLNASHNNIPLSELDTISTLVTHLSSLKSLDLYGNPLSTHATYKYRISSAHHTLESLDGLNLKGGSFLRERLDTLRKEWETARLVDNTQQCARKWVDAERQVKQAAMEMIGQRQERVNEEFERYKKRVDDDVIGFINYIYDQKSKSIGSPGASGISPEVLKTWADNLQQQEAKRNSQLQQRMSVLEEQKSSARKAPYPFSLADPAFEQLNLSKMDAPQTANLLSRENQLNQSFVPGAQQFSLQPQQLNQSMAQPGNSVPSQMPTGLSQMLNQPAPVANPSSPLAKLFSQKLQGSNQTLTQRMKASVAQQQQPNGVV